MYEEPLTENPLAVKPTSVNPTLLNTNKLNTNNTKDILSDTDTLKLLINGFKCYQPSARLISMSDYTRDKYYIIQIVKLRCLILTSVK